MPWHAARFLGSDSASSPATGLVYYDVIPTACWCPAQLQNLDVSCQDAPGAVLPSSDASDPRPTLRFFP